MLDRSHRAWKYGAIIGATVIVPTIYLVVNEGKAESLPLACWVVIGFAVGWDLARMIAGKTDSRGNRRARRDERRNGYGVPGDFFDEELGATHSMAVGRTCDSRSVRIPTLGEQLGYHYFDRYDGYEGPNQSDEH